MERLGHEDEGPAIKALGSLFKLTEVHLWDDGWGETSETELPKVLQDVDVASSNVASAVSDLSSLPEDAELIMQMNELGLPLSFQTKKEKRNGMTKGRKKSASMKHSQCNKETKDEMLESSKVSEVDMVFPTIFQDKTSNSLCCTSLPGQSQSSNYDVAVDSEFQCSINEGEDSASSDRISGPIKQQVSDRLSHAVSDNDQNCNMVSDGDAISNDDMKIVVSSATTKACHFPECCLTDVGDDAGKKELCEHFMEYDCSEASSLSICEKEGVPFFNNNCTQPPMKPESDVHCSDLELVKQDDIGSYNFNADFGDWEVYWDSFYMRNYFYNIITHASTWDPPPGMEHLSFVDISDKTKEMTAEMTEMDVSPSISRIHSESADLCASENNAESFIEPLNCDRVADQPLDKLQVECIHATDVPVSGIAMPTLSSSLDHLDEDLGNNKRYNDSLNFLSDNQKHSNSQENKVNQLGLHEFCISKVQLPFIDNSGELGHVHCLDKLDTVMDCKDDAAFQVSDDISQFTEAVTKDSDMHLGPLIDAKDEVGIQVDLATKKQRKRARRRHGQRKLSDKELQFEGMIEEFPANIGKYWCQRYLLFSRFDDGIRMDEEGWFSVTPEAIARHHAVRCGNGIIVDCFTGVGGNAIQFARRGNRVVAIDVDQKKIDYACHNATIYGVVDQIDFIVGDFFILAATLKADTVFLSPPWGGPDYAKAKTYNIQTMLKPHDGFFLFKCAKEIASRIVLFLPRNVDINQLAELALSALPPWSLEVEKDFLNGKLKAITAYFNSTDNKSAELTWIGAYGN